MMRDTKIKAEERFPITGQGFASGKLLDGRECQILLDTGSTKSYLSKSYYCNAKLYMCYPNLFKHTENSSGKWTVCQHTFCNPSDYRGYMDIDLKFLLWYLKSMTM